MSFVFYFVFFIFVPFLSRVLGIESSIVHNCETFHKEFRKPVKLSSL